MEAQSLCRVVSWCGALALALAVAGCFGQGTPSGKAGGGWLGAAFGEGVLQGERLVRVAGREGPEAVPDRTLWLVASEPQDPVRVARFAELMPHVRVDDLASAGRLLDLWREVRRHLVTFADDPAPEANLIDYRPDAVASTFASPYSAEDARRWAIRDIRAEGSAFVAEFPAFRRRAGLFSTALEVVVIRVTVREGAFEAVVDRTVESGASTLRYAPFGSL